MSRRSDCNGASRPHRFVNGADQGDGPAPLAAVHERRRAGLEGVDEIGQLAAMVLVRDRRWVARAARGADLLGEALPHRVPPLLQAIDDVLYDAFGQRQVATLFTQSNQYRVVEEVDPRHQLDTEALNHLYVRSSISGGLVPLSLVGKLDGFTEGSGTVLDNSATVWFQEMSDGDSHNLNNLPILQAGSCGGYFKTGQAVCVENTSGKGSDTGGTPNASPSSAFSRTASLSYLS